MSPSRFGYVSELNRGPRLVTRPHPLKIRVEAIFVRHNGSIGWVSNMYAKISPKHPGFKSLIDWVISDFGVLPMFLNDLC